ncbi:hypothetical protein LSAT2_014307 [Lamellibrachia satsuma]|nr:hypothetical protein LSAT2_014307 [Lamellibrachia satsuma]
MPPRLPLRRVAIVRACFLSIATRGSVSLLFVFRISARSSLVVTRLRWRRLVGENGEFYQSYPGYNDYFGGPQGDHPMPFLPPTSGQQGAQLVDASGHPAGPMGQEGQYLPAEMLPVPASSPEPNMPQMSHMDGPHPFGNPLISRSLPSAFTQTLNHGPPEMTVGDTW